MLKGKKILITKSAEEARGLFDTLVGFGSELLFFPTIKIVPKTDSDDVIKILSKSYLYDYLIFTSGNAADIFHKTATQLKLDLAHCKIAAVGKSTAEKCRGLGYYIHIVPEEFSANGLLKKFSGYDLNGKKILIPGSSLSRQDLRLGLAQLGAEVTFVPLYDVEELDPEENNLNIHYVQQNTPDIFVFTSPSSFVNFLKMIEINDPKNYFDGKIICAIGEVTESAIKEHDVFVNIVPHINSLEGIMESLNEYFNLTSDIA